MKHLDFLKEVYLFNDLTNEELRWLDERSATRVFIAGETVFREGDDAKALYIVKAGSLEILKRGESSTQSLHTMGPRSVFGEIAFVEREKRNASAECLENVELIEISYLALDERVLADKGFGMKLYQGIARELIKTVARTTRNLTSIRELKLRQVS